MTRTHECECLAEGCECREIIACTPGADWCDDCDEGRHTGARTYPAPETWQKITRPDGEELGYFCGFTYPGDPTRWHEPHSAEGRTCRGSAPTIWDRFTRAQINATAAAQARDRAR